MCIRDRLYVAPGRDAAVAYPGIDLRFKNPYAWPLHIRATAHDNRLDVRLLGAHAGRKTGIQTKIVSHSAPTRQTRISRNGHSYRRSIGLDGYRVVSYRVLYEKGRAVRREQLGDDTYAVMNDVTALARN